MRWLYSRGRFFRIIDGISLALGGGLIFAAILSLFGAQYTEISLRRIITILGGLFVLFCTQVLITHPIHMERLFKVYTAGATICALLGIIQTLLAKFAGVQYGQIMWALGSPIAGILPLYIPRVTSTWLDPNIYGLFLIPGVIFVFIIPQKIWIKGILNLILLSGIAVSYSRTAWISVLVAICILFAFYWLKGGTKKAIKTYAVIQRGNVLILMGFIIAFIISWTNIWERLVDLNPLAFERRIEMTLIGLEYLSKSPFLGVGPGNLLPLSEAYTHNSYISVLIEYGIIGSLCWVLLLVRTIWIGSKNIFQNTNEKLWRLSVASLAALMGLLVGGLSIEIQNAKFLWLIIAIITILGRQKIVKSESSLSRGKLNEA